MYDFKGMSELITLSMIKEDISKDKIRQALIKLKEYLKNHRELEEVVLLSGRYSYLVQQEVRGLIAFKEQVIERNKIRNSIVQLISILDNPLKFHQFRIQVFLTRNWLFIAIITVFLGIGIASHLNNHRKNTERDLLIEKLDAEIAERIKQVDVENWYLYAVENDTVLNLSEKLLNPPTAEDVLNQEYSDRNFRSLINDLYNLVPDDEKPGLENAIDILDSIDTNYSNVDFDVQELRNFYMKVVKLNSIRWSKINDITDEDVEALVGRIIEISKRY